MNGRKIFYVLSISDGLPQSNFRWIHGALNDQIEHDHPVCRAYWNRSKKTRVRTPVSPIPQISAGEFKIPTEPFQSRRRPVLAIIKPPRLALRANLRDENVVMNVFSNEIFNQKGNSTRGTGKDPTRLNQSIKPDPMINPTTICSSGTEEDSAFQELLENHLPLVRKEVLSLLTQRMAELPDTPKKVLAMYYYENMRISEIATCFGLTESRICQIHTQTIGLLRNYLAKHLA